ncbi:MAG TPA: anhydro-N-acetylmuramic acid kinase [Balneolaceae bacterium]|nr:anhydro-N-acetylmuramic acid kinase [Balneolaceae bacterium]
MNPSIKKILETASKEAKLIVGLMSGTSLDGLDIALCEIRGSGRGTKVTLKDFETKTYPDNIKEHLKDITSVSRVSLEQVCLMHSLLGNYHGRLILEALEKWNVSPEDIDCIASHGQTIYHAPKIKHNREEMPNATLQIGDGDHIARTTGILTISDFRQKHTAAGEEGAPLAAFVDQMLYTHKTETRILLNIGGISNFTYLPARSIASQQTITTDTGPGNTLIDAAMQKYFFRDFDEDGAVAKKGTVDSNALRALKADPFFQKPLPKTTGPEVFNLEWVNQRLKKAGGGNLSPENLIATLCRLTAETIADSIRNILHEDTRPVVYSSGGGIHNPTLFGWLKELLQDCTFKDFERIGPDPDAKEAVIFAVLANEMLSGPGFPLDPNNNRSKKLNFGKISFPT